MSVALKKPLRALFPILSPIQVATKQCSKLFKVADDRKLSFSHPDSEGGCTKPFGATTRVSLIINLEQGQLHYHPVSLC